MAGSVLENAGFLRVKLNIGSVGAVVIFKETELVGQKRLVRRSSAEWKRLARASGYQGSWVLNCGWKDKENGFQTIYTCTQGDTHAKDVRAVHAPCM